MPWIMLTLIVGAFAGAATLSLSYRTISEIETPLIAFGDEEASHTALLIYHPGISRFTRNMVTAFANGLVASGWRCHITTASSRAPQDLGAYDLLVLGTPTYNDAPANSIMSYVRDARPITGKAVGLLVTAATSPEWATLNLRRVVEEAGGEVSWSLELLQYAPNINEQGEGNPASIARQAGSAVGLP